MSRPGADRATLHRRTVPLLIIAAVLVAAAVAAGVDGRWSGAAALVAVAAAVASTVVTANLGRRTSGQEPGGLAAFRTRANLFLLTALFWVVAAVSELVDDTPFLAVLFAVAGGLTVLAGIGSHRALRNGTAGQARQQSVPTVEHTGEGDPVVSVHTLLRELGLQSATKDEQVAGVRAWLAGHTAGPALLTSLERNGFAAALDPGARDGTVRD